MASHGVARTSRARTPAQYQADQDKIAAYRDLDARLLAANTDPSALADPATLSLTADLLARNPEHYTAWNVRRRCLTCGSLSKRSPGPSPSAPSATSSTHSTAPTSSAAWSPSGSAVTQPAPASRPHPSSGRSGTTAEGSPAPDVAVPEANATLKTDDKTDDKHSALVLDTLRSELQFTFPLIKANPKCYWIWNYRLWLLQQAIELLPVAAARRVWDEELGLVALMLTKDQRNFHAWGYRRHVVRTLESEALAGSTMSEAEFAYTERMISAGLSNFSAWHHRSRVIPRLLDERGFNDAERRAFLDAEFSLVRRALDVGPEDQSCWYYHQFLVLNITEPVGKQTIAPNLSAEDKVPILQSEIDNIKDLLEDYDDDLKLAYEALMDYTPALARLEGREETEANRAELQGWLAKLRKLDPMRKGRWDDFERAHSLR
ncbi:geranylgeranyl transferase type-2 subunit alpha [Verticillium alfalfae VaMs.102]|uniref:Geranylgeranyl transferase type-2 subunit alpha n=1 Tax=Verticillium alfalfae (strain VaMs.102 / ATCC MYA-4576 / FGSC 10136) TaxID=526221 RepID=C9SFB0_VERA1|nr:geranylgeranyl transferase type-2 subunit alpha [Verticillium alfalfae VaMs.102]EEY17896.1 geranylgeranyl transferase type-2 subunit alpha [Verticillium alfalfae VaMs.102]